jgi:Aspartate/tyrosine/aromatic aminotransferase
LGVLYRNIKLSGGVPVIVDTSQNGFKFNLKMLESNLTKKTRGLIINSPSNPTGVLMDEKDIIEIANFVKKKGLYIITDDIYEKIIFDDKKFFNALMAGKSMKENTVAVNAVSKTYSMTGFRIGYTAGPKDLISAMNNIQSQSTSNPTTFAQYGALAALKGGYDFTVMMRNEFQKRRDYMMDFFDKNIKSVTPVKPDGAFYIFADISKVFDESGNKINSSTEFCDYF